jgi:hypothetical protein
VTGYLKPELMLRSVTEAAVLRCLTKPVAIIEMMRVIQEAVKAHDASLAAAP